MKIRCNQCGQAVSTEVPDTTLVRAWIECPDCAAQATPPPAAGVFSYSGPVYVKPALRGVLLINEGGRKLEGAVVDGYYEMDVTLRDLPGMRPAEAGA